MESNIALVRVASGLERLMVGIPQNGPIKDSTVAQISAALFYQANVISKLENNKAFQETFKTTIFNQIMEDFGLYIDAKARMNPKSLHHVYEWKKTGNRNARLFKLTKSSSAGISFKIGYEFLPSKSSVPATKGKRRHVFANKASIMEAGMPLIIRPRRSERLVFEGRYGMVFMPKGASVTVKRPGGSKATNQFNLAYSQFFKSNMVNESIKKSGFQKIFNAATAKAMNIPGNIKTVKYRFSPNSVASQADAAVTAAYGGVLV